MTKPLDTVAAALLPASQPSQLTLDAITAVEAVPKTATQINYHIDSYAVLCRRHGQTALLAEIERLYGSEVKTAGLQCLIALSTMWPTISDQTLPTFPDEPVSEEPVE